MSPATNKNAYMRHYYSGPRKSMKRIRAGLKRWTDETSRKNFWRSQKSKTEPLNEQIVNDDSVIAQNTQIRKIKTYERIKPKIRFESTDCSASSSTVKVEPVIEPLKINWPQPDPEIDQFELTVKTVADAGPTTPTRASEPLEEDDLPSQPLTSADASEGEEQLNQSTPIDYVTTVVCPNCNTEMELANPEEPLSKARTIIAKVYHFLEREYHTLKERYGDLDLSPLLKFRARTAEATGVSESMVSEILMEEQEMKKNLPQVKRAEKRKRDQDVQDETDRSQGSCGDDASLDESDDDDIPTENQTQKKAEPEMEMLVVKLETPDDQRDMEQADPDSDMLFVHIEPADDHSHKTLKQGETSTTGYKTTIFQPNVNVLSESQKQGEKSTTEFTTTIFHPNVNEPSESGILDRDPIKIEDVEIKEEGFS